MNIQVVHIIDHFGVGGAQRFLHDLVLAQQRSSSIQPSVCCLRERTELSTQLEQANVRLWHLGAGRWHPLRIALLFPRLYRLLRRGQPDIVHTHLFASNLFGRIAALLLGIPVVVHEQCNESATASWIRKRIDCLLARQTSAIICVSRSTAEFNAVEKCVPLEKIHTIPNSIDVNGLAPTTLPRHGADVREEFRLPKDGLIITGIGRLVPQKRFDLFLEIAAMVLQVRKDVSFLIAGDGSEGTKLKAMAEAEGIASHVHFLGTRNDIGRILDLSDLFLLMSDFEGLPLTLLESMAKGVCVIATDVDGTHDVLAGTNAGLLVPPGDYRTAAQSILTLLDDSGRREKMTAAAREVVSQSYGIEAAASKIEAIYRGLCNVKANEAPSSE